MPIPNPRYVILMSFTEAGAQDVSAALAAVEQTRSVLEPLQATEHAFVVTMGGYDIVTVIEAEGDDAAAYYARSLSDTGKVTTETLRGYEPSDFRTLMGLGPLDVVMRIRP